MQIFQANEYYTYSYRLSKQAILGYRSLHFYSNFYKCNIKMFLPIYDSVFL